MEIVAKRLKEARLNRGYTIVELENYSSISKSNISKWERNITTPNTMNMRLIAKVLDVSVDWLLGKGGALDAPKFISFKGVKEGTEDIRKVEDLVVDRICRTEEDGVEMNMVYVRNGVYIRTKESIWDICTKLKKVGLIGEVVY